MNPTQIAGIVRAMLAWGFGALAAKGLFPGEWMETAIGLGGAIGVAVWSYYSNSITHMINTVAKSEEVHEIIVDQAIANKAPSTKVVPLS